MTFAPKEAYKVTCTVHDIEVIPAEEEGWNIVDGELDISDTWCPGEGWDHAYDIEKLEVGE